MDNKVLSVIFLFLLGGCGSPPVWVKPGATQADFEQDVARCRYEAAAATASYSTGPTARGLSGAMAQGFGEGLTSGMRQIELVKLCLEAKGYSQQVVSTKVAEVPAPVASPKAQGVAVTASKTNNEKTQPETKPKADRTYAASVGGQTQAAAKSELLAGVDRLNPGVSTIADAIDILGRPTAEGTLSNGTRLIQWFSAGNYVAILFDATGRMVRVARKTSADSRTQGVARFDLVNVDQLKPGVSTITDANDILGIPNSESTFANGTRLLQWFRVGTHVAILFDAAGQMVRVTHRFQAPSQ